MLSELKNLENFNRHISYAGSRLGLNARVSFLGREYQDKPGYDWYGLKRGQREFILWQYTLSGQGKLIYEGRTFDLTPGTAMLVHIPHDHRYFLPPGGGHWEFIFLILRGTECMRICREAEKINGPLIAYSEQLQSLECAREIFRQALSPSPDCYRLSALAYQFSLSLFADIKPQTANSRPPVIDNAVLFALNHYDEPIAVEDMAEAAGLSRYHFSREFKKYMQLPPADFIRKLRLEKAVNLLQADDLSIIEIAAQCGFQSASYFCRAFLKEFNISPGKYRHDRQ